MEALEGLLVSLLKLSRSELRIIHIYNAIAI
jgi:hypothetical protein